MENKMLKTGKKIKEGKPVTIVFLGDSVTEGCFEPDQTDRENAYHARLGRMLKKEYPQTDVRIVNAGIGGENAGQGLKRLERDVLKEQPDLCVVCFGLNNAPSGESGLSEYENDMDEIFKRLKAAGVETICMTPNAMNRKEAVGLDPNLTAISRVTAMTMNSGMMDRYMEILRKTASQNQAAIADCYRIWQNLYQEGVDTDGMLSNQINHPTREAHQIFADELYRTLFSEEQEI